MSEQQPHVEVFSRNRISRSTVILGVVPVTIFSLVLAYALWAFLWWIAVGVLALLAIGALYLVAIALIDVRRRWLHAPYLPVSPHGEIDTASGRQFPLALPAPRTTVTEEKEAEAKLDKDIIALWNGGRNYRDIAADLKTNFSRVQKVVAEYKKQPESA
jgi:hypothetical protein